MITTTDYHILTSALSKILYNYVYSQEADNILRELGALLRDEGVIQPEEPADALAFDAFWEAYDKKVERKKTEALWGRLSKRDRVAAIAYLPAYKAAQPDKRFRKNPATFLRNRGWEDEIIAATTLQEVGNDTVMQRHDGGLDNMETW